MDLLGPNSKSSDCRAHRHRPPVGAPGSESHPHRSSHLTALSLTGELAALKNQVFVLKEGVDYKVKITFKVRVLSWGHQPAPGPAPEVPVNTVCLSGQQGDRQWTEVSASHLPPRPAR